MQIQFIIARHYRNECNTQPCNAYLAVQGKLCHRRYSVIHCNSIHQALATHYFQFVTKYNQVNNAYQLLVSIWTINAHYHQLLLQQM